MSKNDLALRMIEAMASRLARVRELLPAAPATQATGNTYLAGNVLQRVTDSLQKAKTNV